MNLLRTGFVLSAIGLALAVSSGAEARKRMDGTAARPASPPSPFVADRANAASPPLVVFGDKILGTDPDVFIRQQLLRDLGAVFGGNF